MSTRDGNPPNDPMNERESAKYEFPVPSREAVITLLAERAEPLAFDDITRALGVEGGRDLEAF